LPDDFVLIGAGEMPQKPLRSQLVKKKFWKFLSIAVYRLLEPASG
jgi:hypothetical protein